MTLAGVGIRGDARDQDVGLALGIKKVPEVPGMNDVEDAMAHDDLPRARVSPNRRNDFLDRLYFVPEFFSQ
jgi:hypothetical protein